jgi:hypothetical protein
VALALAVAGCGGDDDVEPSDKLAGFAPADSLVYVESAVKPEGDQQEAIESVVDRFPRGDELGRDLIGEINADLKTEGLSYEEDVEPLLGERAAFFLNQTEPESGALLAETTDEEGAREKLREALSKEGEVSEKSHAGVSYEAVGTESAFAVVDGVAVVGTEPGVQAALDARNGDGVDQQEQYASFVEQREDLVASLYADVATLLDVAVQSGDIPQSQVDAIKGVYGNLTQEPVLASLQVTEDRITVDASAAQGPSSDSAVQQSDLIEQGPSEAWAGLAFSSLGEAVNMFTEQLSSVQEPGFNLQTINRQLQRQLGITLQDLTDVGDAGAFVAGESIVELKAGAIVQVADAAARTSLVDAIRTAVRRDGEASIGALGVEGAEGFSIMPPGLPVPINVASGDDRIVVAGGNETTETLLSGEGGASSSLDDARAALGDDFTVSFFLSFAPLLDLAQVTGEGDPDFERVRPYLEALDVVAYGSQRSGARDLSRLVVELTEE